MRAGFEALGKLACADAHAEGVATCDGAHPVSCVDRHAPETMALRVTRPGFPAGIAALAAGDALVPHLPSIERWRAGDRKRP